MAEVSITESTSLFHVSETRTQNPPIVNQCPDAGSIKLPREMGIDVMEIYFIPSNIEAITRDFVMYKLIRSDEPMPLFRIALVLTCNFSR